MNDEERNIIEEGSALSVLCDVSNLADQNLGPQINKLSLIREQCYNGVFGDEDSWPDACYKDLSNGLGEIIEEIVKKLEYVDDEISAKYEAAREAPESASPDKDMRSFLSPRALQRYPFLNDVFCRANEHTVQEIPPAVLPLVIMKLLIIEVIQQKAMHGDSFREAIEQIRGDAEQVLEKVKEALADADQGTDQGLDDQAEA